MFCALLTSAKHLAFHFKYMYGNIIRRMQDSEKEVEDPSVEGVDNRGAEFNELSISGTVGSHLSNYESSEYDCSETPSFYILDQDTDCDLEHTGVVFRPWRVSVV